MTTVLDLITDALQDANILAADEAASPSDAQKAFRLLNRMLDADSTEKLMIYNNVQEVFPFISGQETYNIGPGGDFNTSRPDNITGAYVRDPNGNDIQVNVINYAEYSEIISKQISGTIPLVVYYNAGYPLSQLTFWPVPTDTDYRFVLWSWKPLTSFVTINDAVSLAPGYEEYIETNLAVRCCIAYNRQLPDELVLWAQKSKDKMKRINAFVPLLKLPAGLGVNSVTKFPIPPSILTGYS